MAAKDRWLIDPAEPAIGGHVVKGRIITPFAFWLSRSLDAVTAFQAAPPQEFREVLVRKPVVLGPACPVEVEFSSAPERDGGRFELSLAQAAPSERISRDILVEGSWRDSVVEESDAPHTATQNARDGEQFYRAAGAAGLSYGQFLLRIVKISVDNNAWSAELSAPPGSSPAASDRISAFDALLQCGSVLAADGGETCWIPFRIERIHFRDALAVHGIRRVAGEWIRAGAAEEDERVANLFGFLPGDDTAAVAFLAVHYRVLKEEPAPRQSTSGNRDAGFRDEGLEDIVDRLRATTPALQRQTVVRFIENQLLEVLQWDDSMRGELQRGFLEVGLDSLNSIDLQFRLQAAFRFALPIGQKMEQTSIEEMADFLVQKYQETG